MISRHTRWVPKEEVVFRRLLYSDSRCSQTCRWRSQVLPGMLLAHPDLPAHPDLSSTHPDLSSLSQTCSRWFETCLRLSQSCHRRSQTCRRHSQSCRRRSQTCCRHSQTCRQRSQAGRWRSQTCRWHSQVLPDAPNVPSGAPRCSQTYHNHSHGTPLPVIRDPSYSEGQPECPPRVWYPPEIDESKFALHILSETPGGFQWLKYILLMKHSITPSAAYTKWSVHLAQHTPKIVCPPVMLTIPSWPLSVASASSVPLYRSNTTSQLSIQTSQVKAPCHILIVASYWVWLMNRVLKPSTPPNDHVEALLQSRSIMASNGLSSLTGSRRLSVSVS